MTPGTIVELIDHMPLFSGRGRAGSRFRVDQLHKAKGTVNLADRTGALVACDVPVGRLRVVEDEAEVDAETEIEAEAVPATVAAVMFDDPDF